MTSKKRSSSCLRTAVIVFLMLACISVAGGLALIGLLPQAAAKEFGPPDRKLDPLQKALYSARVLLQQDDLLTPMDASTTAPIRFQIQNGDSVNLIALHLENAGLIHDAGAFRFYLIYSGADTQLQSGDFTLSPAVSAVEIAKTLQDANAKEVTFQILAGWRLEEIGAGLAVSGLSIQPEDFMSEVINPSPGVLPGDMTQLKTLEGFLLPGVYHFRRSSTAADVVAAATAQFDAQVTTELRQAFARQGLDLYQAVTLASIVQRESMVEEEQPIIASVFYNRLNQGMKLDSDPTVQYAFGYNQDQKTWWTNPLSLDDLKVDSPYNTYMGPGLPPGPIAMPGLSALRAVAYPAQTPYLYFRAKCDGSGTHNFSTTFEEHLGQACP